MPKSEVVRAAIAEYHDRIGRLQRERKAADAARLGRSGDPRSNAQRCRSGPGATVNSPGPPGGSTPARLVIFLDTSLLVDALTGPRRSAAASRHAIQEGERTKLPSLALRMATWTARATGTGCPGIPLPERGSRTVWLAGRGAERQAVTGLFGGRGGARSTSPSLPARLPTRRSFGLSIPPTSKISQVCAYSPV
jgi:hypothetical protein